MVRRPRPGGCCALLRTRGHTPAGSGRCARLAALGRARPRLARAVRRGAARGPRAGGPCTGARRSRCSPPTAVNTAGEAHRAPAAAAARRGCRRSPAPCRAAPTRRPTRPPRSRPHGCCPPALPARAALRAGRRAGAVAPLPRRALPDRHRGRRAPRRARLAGAPRHEGRHRRACRTRASPRSSTRSRTPGAEAANYPFTTVEPNVAVVPVPRRAPRPGGRAAPAPSPIVYETIEFHDIAGLVRGAHQGEGLGNQFLANIRETDAIVHVVRVHDDEQVVHPEGRVDPLADVDTIETELLYADLEQAERRLERVSRQAQVAGDTQLVAEEAWLREVIDGARRGGRAGARCRRRRTPRTPMRLLQPLTSKPVLYVANVARASARGARRRWPRTPSARGARRRGGERPPRGRAGRARRRRGGGDARRAGRARVRARSWWSARRSPCST